MFCLLVMGSTHFQVSRVDMLIAQLETFCSSYCGMHFVKYFLDEVAFHFSCLRGNITWYQLTRSELAFQ